MDCYRPDYLKGLTGTSFEVQRATIDVVEFTKKALGAGDLLEMGVSPEEGGSFYKALVANTRVDRHREKFSKEVLDLYVSSFNKMGASLNFAHSSTNLIGKVVKMWTEGVGSDTNMMAVFWVDDAALMPNQPNMTVNHAISKGVVKDVSLEAGGSIRLLERKSESDPYIWEYYIDPKRPDATEFHGLAIVQRGAQRGAAIVKEWDGQHARDNAQKNIFMDKETLYIDGVKHVIKATYADGKVSIDPTDMASVETAIASLNKKAADLVAEKAAAEAARDLAAAEAKAFKDHFETMILNLQSSLNVPAHEAVKEADLHMMTPASLIEKSKSLGAKLEPSAISSRVEAATFDKYDKI